MTTIIEGNDFLKEEPKKKNQVPSPTVMHNVDGRNTSVNEVPFTSKPDWEALPLLIISQLVRAIFVLKKVRNTPSKYLHSRLKWCDDRFASDMQCKFQALDWTERIVGSKVYFTERKQLQTDTTVGSLQN